MIDRSAVNNPRT